MFHGFEDYKYHITKHLWLILLPVFTIKLIDNETSLNLL